ncbi:MAG: BlaI/MecI/CopY family transcriptional regulator [Streptosporangiaceae bacterium]
MSEPGTGALPRVGPLERVVLTVLWDATEPMRVRAVREQMSYPECLADTTVATILGNLCSKGHVTRVKHGNRWHYAAARTREEHLAWGIRVLLAEAPDPAAVLTLAARPAGQAPPPHAPGEAVAVPAGVPVAPRATGSSPGERWAARRAFEHAGIGAGIRKADSRMGDPSQSCSQPQPGDPAAAEHRALGAGPGDLPALTLVLPGDLGKDGTLADLIEAIGQVRGTLSRRAGPSGCRVEQCAATGDQLGQALYRGQLLANWSAIAAIDEAITAVFGLQPRYESILGLAGE